MKYIGYFKSLDNKSYRVEIGSGNESTEILLAGNSPFTVDYSASKTPFDTLRTSTATIQIVHNTYLFDVFSAQAQGTPVVLYNETNSTITWRGYLKSNLHNQGYKSEYETIELEASDCLCSLQYLDYGPSIKLVRTFKNLLGDICTKSGLDAFYIVKSKKVDNSWLNFDSLKVSDGNFFSSDSTETPWKYSEILSEICNYLGYTAFQWGSSLYLVDYQVYHSADSMEANYWLKSEDYSTGHTTTLGSKKNITKDSYRGSDGNISMDHIYNKVKVNANFYEVGNFIPDIFDEDLITNAGENKYSCNNIPVPQPYQVSYINNRNKITQEEKADTNYTYLEKVWNNSKYTTKSLDSSTYQPVTRPYSYRVVKITPVYDPQYGTQLEGYQVELLFRNDVSRSLSLIVSLTSNQETVTENIDVIAYSTVNKTIGLDATRDGLQMTISCEGEIYDIGFISISSDFDKNVIFASIVESASVAVPALAQYFYETESNVNFTKYIKFACDNKPVNRLQPAGVLPEQIETYYPSLLALNSGYTCPIITDNNSFLYISTSAINERYRNRPYIDPDWSGQATGIGDEYNIAKWGIISGSRSVWTAPPTLTYKLGIGNKWWNGSAWQNSECAFYIQLGMELTDDNVPDYTKLWNTDHQVCNNVDWQDWAGVSGYKIPLSGVDLSNEIHFEMLLPGKVQEYNGQANSGFNSYVWVKNFKLGIACKGSKNFDKADVLYENVIDSGSTNEMSEISVKLTTWAGQGNMSFSNVGYNNQYLGAISEPYLSDSEARVAEENIIERYIEQYSTPTKKETLTVDMGFTPLDKITDTYWNQNFVILGQSIDYSMARQQITIIEKK